jgi:hypothetical protein
VFGLGNDEYFVAVPVSARFFTTPRHILFLADVDLAVGDSPRRGVGRL